MRNIYKWLFFTLSLFFTLPLIFTSFTSTLASTPFNDEWDGSMLYFDPFYGCETSCTEIKAKICNRRNAEPMQGTTEYQLYYNQDGDPQSGTVLYSGTVNQLDPDECQTITYNPQNKGGSYRFIAKQRPGFPGEPLVKSDICKVNQCSDSSPSPTPIASTSPKPSPSQKPSPTPTASPTPDPSPKQQPFPTPDPDTDPKDSDDNGGTGGGGTPDDDSSGGSSSSQTESNGQVAGATHLADTGNQDTYAVIGLLTGIGFIGKSCYDLFYRVRQTS